MQDVVGSVKIIGANGQISLGKKFAGRQVLVEEQRPGVWLVRTATIIPDDELWLHEPEAAAQLRAALKRAQDTPADDSTTEAILERLRLGK